MPRPERPLDAAAGPVQRFAADLRTLRAEQGLTYRELANEAHFSKATLSAAAAGHRLPTWEVTSAYVQACGGDPETWRDRWRAIASDAGLLADASRPTTGKDGSGQRADPSEVPGRWASQRRTNRAALVILAAALVVGAGTAGILSSRSAPNQAPLHAANPAQASPARFEGASQPITDNSDPKRTQCAFDPGLKTLDSVEINTAAENLLGIAELRYSPRCHAAWGRFVPSARMTRIKEATITITAQRPATKTSGTRYRVAFDGQAAFGNILRTQRGCVVVTIVVRASGGGGTGVTHCQR
jgi:transcriptional regulator with XRE-family HTH domain